MTIGEWIEHAENRLKSAWVESPRLEAQLLAAHVENESRSWILAHPEIAFNELAGEPLLQRRESREPLAYILGYREFYGRRFSVKSGVLIPRQETEILVEAVIDLQRDFPKIATCLDVGTGSGCIAVTLALETKLQVSALDVSAAAIDVAARNVHDLNASVELLLSDKFDGVGERKFDLIVSNPPYVREDAMLIPEIGDHEPHVALYAGEDGLSGYRWLAEGAVKHVNPGGWVLVEIGAGMEETVSTIFEFAGWEMLRSLKDLSQIIRVLGFRLR